MRRRRRGEATVSLFPFLSILVCLMGVLGFITVTVALLAARNPVVELRSVGEEDPKAKRPVFVECHADRLVIHPGGGQGTQEVAVAAIGEESEPFMELLERLAARRDHRYVVFAVYPDGVDCFVEGRNLAEEREIDLGFEPMLTGWRLGLDGPQRGGA